MFVKYLCLHCSHRRIEGHEAPKLSDRVLDAFSKLDGEEYSQLIVSQRFPEKGSGLPFGGAALEISGGKNDQYYCQVFQENGDSYVPYDEELGCDKMVDLNRGCPEQVCLGCVITGEQATAILLQFSKDGTQHHGLHWVKVGEQEKGSR